MKTGIKLRVCSFLAEQQSACKAFFTYIRFRDLWAALYSIIFVVTASLWFGRIPKMPLAFLVCLPFIYLSVLGASLLFLGLLRDRYIGKPRRAFLQRFLGPESPLAGYLKRDGARMLRTAFATGVYLFLGLLYLALGPDRNNLGWLLMPCLFIGMAAIFSLNQHVLETQSENQTNRPFPNFKTLMIKRSLYMCLLALSLYLMAHYLVLPLRQALWGE